jgi:ParD-like antitoxin of type II bacterial toxin-antitoxin system
MPELAALPGRRRKGFRARLPTQTNYVETYSRPLTYARGPADSLVRFRCSPLSHHRATAKTNPRLAQARQDPVCRSTTPRSAISRWGPKMAISAGFLARPSRSLEKISGTKGRAEKIPGRSNLDAWCRSDHGALRASLYAVIPSSMTETQNSKSSDLICVRMPSDLREAAARAAAEDHRTLSQQVRYWIACGIEARSQPRHA